MPGQMVDPALLPQLGHDGVNPREACLALGPLGQGLGVAVPGDLDADGVPLHAVKPGVVGSCRVEKLSPQELAKQGEGGCAVPLHLGGWEGQAGSKHLPCHSAPPTKQCGAATNLVAPKPLDMWQAYFGKKPLALAVPCSTQREWLQRGGQRKGLSLLNYTPGSKLLRLGHDPYPQGSVFGSTF